MAIIEIQPIVTDTFHVLVGSCPPEDVIPKLSFTIPQQIGVTEVNVLNFQKAKL